MNRFLIEGFIHVLKLTPARRQSALERIYKEILSLSPEVQALLVPLVMEALKAQDKALTLVEEARLANEIAMHATGAKETDAKLDRLLSTLRDALETIATTFAGEESQLAKKLLEELLPDGVVFFTKKPFIEQHAALRKLIGKFRQPTTWDALRKLQLTRWVEQLESLNVTYGEQLTRPEPKPREEIKAADLLGYIAMVQVVAAVCGLYPTNSEAHLAGRQKLLGPIVEQEEEAALLRARRRSGTPSGLPAEDEEDEDVGEEEGGEALDEEAPADAA